MAFAGKKKAFQKIDCIESETRVTFIRYLIKKQEFNRMVLPHQLQSHHAEQSNKGKKK